MFKSNYNSFGMVYNFENEPSPPINTSYINIKIRYFKGGTRLNPTYKAIYTNKGPIDFPSVRKGWFYCQWPGIGLHERFDVIIHIICDVYRSVIQVNYSICYFNSYNTCVYLFFFLVL